MHTLCTVNVKYQQLQEAIILIYMPVQTGEGSCPYICMYAHTCIHTRSLGLQHAVILNADIGCLDTLVIADAVERGHPSMSQHNYI